MMQTVHFMFREFESKSQVSKFQDYLGPISGCGKNGCTLRKHKQNLACLHVGQKHTPEHIGEKKKKKKKNA